MLLREAVFAIQREGERAAVCAKQLFHLDAPAQLVNLTDTYEVPPAVLAEGFVYFLGREDVLALLQFAAETSLTGERVVDLVCHYAVYDAYPEWAGARSGGSKNANGV